MATTGTKFIDTPIHLDDFINWKYEYDQLKQQYDDVYHCSSQLANEVEELRDILAAVHGITKKAKR